MKTLAKFIKEYPTDVHPFKKLDDIEKYADFMESKPIYDPKDEFWKDFEEISKSKADGWLCLKHENWKLIFWFSEKQVFEDVNGEVLQSYEEIVRYILRT